MNNTITFCLALLLGTIAAGLNWLWVSSQVRPPTFAAVENNTRAGDSFNEDNLVAVPVPGDKSKLKQSLVPYQNRAVLFGLTATRDYAAGDIILQRDIQPPEKSSQWDVVGPFRLISVGEKFSQDDEYASNSSDNNVTIAVDANFDDKTRRLLEVLSGAGGSGESSSIKIAAVQVVPSQGSRQSSPVNVASNDVYQTVSLQGIANVPRVLLEGDMIRFVIPGRPSY